MVSSLLDDSPLPGPFGDRGCEMSRHIGVYEVEGQVGSGGMGAIFRGRDPRFDRPVAIKLLHSQFQGDAGIVDRFKAEAVIQAKLNHPHIVTVLDFVAEEGTLAIVMEFVDGEPLSRTIESAGGPLAADRVARLMDQILSAMSYAHGAGLVHRDIKPSNVLVQRFGTDEVAKVMDFGIAKILGSEKLQTATGAKMGTLAYMSPEHVRSPKHVDARSDIYSLGVVLYELVSGTLPFDAESEYELMRRIVEEPVPDVREVAGPVPAPFGSVIERALAKDPAERFQTCDEMRAALIGRPVAAEGAAPTVPATAPAWPRSTPATSARSVARTAAPGPAVTAARIEAPPAARSGRGLLVGAAFAAAVLVAAGAFLIRQSAADRAASAASQQLEAERVRAEEAKKALDGARLAAEARLAEEGRLADLRATAEQAARAREQHASDDARAAQEERVRRARADLEAASAKAAALQAQGEAEAARNVARAAEADVPPDLVVALATELAAVRRLVKELEDAVLQERSASAARQERARSLEIRLDLARRQLAEGKFPEAKSTCEQLLAEPGLPEETRAAGQRLAAEADESLRRVFEKSRVGPTRQKPARN
jgi:hypothetical protein